MKKPISIVFFGSSENSKTVLKALKETNFSITMVITTAPHTAGRNKFLTKTPVHLYAEENQIPVQTPDKLDSRFQILYSKQTFNLAIVADYSKKLPKKLINHPKHGTLNLHPSLLPKYRGSTPAQAAILNGDQETGISIIKMDEKFDHGPIISWSKEEIKPTDTAESLYKRLFEIGSQVLVTILPSWIEGRIITREQDHSKTTYSYRLTRNHGFIPWPIIQKAMIGKPIKSNDLNQELLKYLKSASYQLSAISYKLIERSIRAFYPWPGVWTKVKTKRGEKRLKILSSHLENNKLLLDEVQLEGQQPSTFNQIKNQIL